MLGVALLASVAAVAPASAAVNLVTNGSFESFGAPGDFTGWTYAGTDDGHKPSAITYGSATGYPTGAFGEAVPADNAVSGSPDAVGNHAAYFVSDAATQTLSQTFHLDAGDYTIGFSAYVPFNGFNNEFNATFTGAVAGDPLALFDVDSSTPGVWKSFSGLAHITTAGDYTTSFQFVAGAFPAGDVVIDRVYVVAGDVTGAVPEPASWAMMLAGFGMIGGALRSRRRGNLQLG
jgi:hypothetical protein